MSGRRASRSTAPLAARSRPSPIAQPAEEPAAAALAASGGSGRLRIAVEIVITLTRQAETATTTSVSSTPSAKAIRRLRAVTAYSIWSPASASEAPNALAITITIP